MKERGIEHLKNALLFIVTLGESIDEGLADDGKLDLSEGFQAALQLKDLPAIIKSGPEILEEFKDLDNQERGELIQFVHDELDITNDKVEAIIETGLELLGSLTKFIQILSKD